MKITIGIDGKGAAYAAKRVQKYEQELQRKTDELCRRLAEIGREDAYNHFATAAYDGVRDFDVQVEQRGENTYAVVASGATVLFLEFGAGVHYPEHEEPLGFSHGTYGKGHGAEDYWFYTGQPDNAGGVLAYGHSNTTITHGNPPSQAMYNARKLVIQQVQQIAREVFG